MDTDQPQRVADEERRPREAGLDDTIAATFPASDPLSSLPDPDASDAPGDRTSPVSRSE